MKAANFHCRLVVIHKAKVRLLQVGDALATLIRHRKDHVHLVRSNLDTRDLTCIGTLLGGFIVGGFLISGILRSWHCSGLSEEKCLNSDYQKHNSSPARYAIVRENAVRNNTPHLNVHYIRNE